MSQELKQRAPASAENEKSPVDATKGNLVTVKPDYVIQVFYKYDPESKKNDPESEANLSVLSSILRLNGFVVNARADSNTNYLLLFVQLNDDAFEHLLKLSNQIDVLFHVKNTSTNTEKVSIAERLRLIYMKLTLTKEKGGCGIEVGKNNVKTIMPVGNIINLNNEAKNNTSRLGKLFRSPIRKENERFLRENLGSNYALYYKFVQGYVSSVGCIAVFGILAWFFLGNFSLLYAIINLTIGLTCYLCVYGLNLKSQRDWNLKNVSKTEIMVLEESELIPEWKVLLRRILFVPVTIFCSIFLFCVQFACFLLEIFINEVYVGPYKSILSLVPTICVCAAVPIITAIYGIIAGKYIAFEKNPTSERQNKSLLYKMFSFSCLASYSPLLITAFIYFPIGYALDPYLDTIKALTQSISSSYKYVPQIPTLDAEYKVNNLRMSSQIFYFMVINQVVGTLTEYALPIALSKILAVPKIASFLGTPPSAKDLDMKSVDEPEEHEFLELVRADLSKPVASIDADYNQHVIQYGFLMLFGPVWALGALSCFVFGLIQQEGDYMKYIKLARPSVPTRGESSEPWITFMRSLLIIGSFVSIAITLMYNRYGSMEIDSFVGKSSVQTSWLTVIGGAMISSILMQILVKSFEMIIQSVYDVEEEKKFNHEMKANKIISAFASKKEHPSSTDVDFLLQEVSTLQSTY